MEKYYTAKEAAAVLGLNYHTFMWRVRNGQYYFEDLGNAKVFLKKYIDTIRAATTNASDQQSLA